MQSQRANAFACSPPANGRPKFRPYNNPTAGLANRLTPARVRFASQADISQRNRHVRFTPESGHLQCTSVCLLWANSGHRQAISGGCARSNVRQHLRLLMMSERWNLLAPGRPLPSGAPQHRYDWGRLRADLKMARRAASVPTSFSEQYRARAEECRRKAETFKNTTARARMLDLAAEYERKAREAEAKESQKSETD